MTVPTSAPAAHPPLRTRTGPRRATRALRDSWLVAERDMTQWVREPQMIVWV